MDEKQRFPTGIEDFEEMRTMGYYYIDKTGLISILLKKHGKVNLFTRPRRFGKTLNMSMLKYFFEIGSDRTLFEGLEIASEKELCDKYMGKFPINGKEEEGISTLVIPNREIHWIYIQQIRRWFQDETRKDVQKLKKKGH